MKYLFFFLVLTYLSPLDIGLCSQPTFEGIIKVRHELSNQDTLFTSMTLKNAVVREEGFNYRYYVLITDFANHSSKYFDKNDSLLYDLNFDTLSSNTVKLKLPSKKILSYSCIPYKNLTEKINRYGHVFQYETTLWVAEDLDNCLYSKYGRLNYLISNPTNKIALRVEKQLLIDGEPEGIPVISEVYSIERKNIEYDLKNIHKKQQ